MIEYIQIKREDLIKARDKAGSHANVIEALCPEIFEPEVHDEVGSMYRWHSSIYMVVRHTDKNTFTLVCLNCNNYYTGNYSTKPHSGQALMNKTDLTKHLKDLISSGLIKYLGHRDDLLDFSKCK